MEKSTNNNLCTRCTQTHFQPLSFMKYFYPSRGSFEYDISMLDLRSSTVESNCSWCGIVHEYMLDLLADISKSDGMARDSMITDCGWTDSEFDLLNQGTGTVHIIVAIRDMKEVQSFTEKIVEIWTKGGYKYARYFSAIAREDDDAGVYISGRPLLEDLRSPEAVDQMRVWTRECKDRHESCALHNECGFFPLRILDLGRHGPGNNELDRVFIISKKPDSNTHADTNLNYAALSYSWGGEANFKSTLEQISSYESKGIAIEDLPKTIQDAIFCAKQMGLRYLWVDALCIIQDDPADKRKQIPRIRETFHFATVTIVASRSETVYDGFLWKPRSSGRRSGPLPYYSPSSSTAGTFHLVQTYIHEYSDDPVNTRAWTLEEALLSPRLLIYSACGLQWQCQQVTDVACQGAGNHVSFGARDAHYRLPHAIFSGDSASSSQMGDYDSTVVAEDLESARISWAGCLRRYTSRQLTRENDKLQALSGLAEQYAIYFSTLLPANEPSSALKGSPAYFAGLWRHQMPQALTWSHDIETKLSPRPQNYRAPSWSWASIDGMIHTAYVGEVFAFEILQVHVPFHNPDYCFGRVTAGCRIDVFGLLKEVNWDPAAKLLLLPGSSDDSRQLDCEILLDAAGEIGTRIFLVPIQRYYRGRRNQSAIDLSLCGWRYEGLVLRRDGGGVHNSFIRVGCFRWTNGEQFSELWKKVTSSRFSII